LASTANVITSGRARFTLLTDHMLRIEWAEDGRFEDRATLAAVHRALPDVPHKLRRTGGWLVVATRGFTLEYCEDGRPFSKKNLRARFRLNGNEVVWTPGLRDRDNLGATLRTLDQIKGRKRPEMKETQPGQWEATGRWIPVDLGNGFLSRSGWALVDDSTNVVLDGTTQWVATRTKGRRCDWYLLMHGHDYLSALREAALVFGRQPLPPRYAFGYWWSRYWAYTDRELETLVGQFDAHRVPLDVMVLDMDWHKEGWTGYTWDRRYFPDPDDFLAWLKARDLKITLNLHPADGVSKVEESFPAMARAMGQDARKTDRIPLDLTNPIFVDAYFRILHHPMEQKGVDFWWMDWQQGQKTSMPGLDPLPWINHLHWRDMETNPRRRGQRPLIFSRFGGVGAGRYCVGFSGDTHSVWESLQFQPCFTATASNVLYGYWSHDIGGHMPGEIDPELYTRWLQFGIFSPIVRTHTTKNPKAERRVWAYPDPYGAIMADALRWRYELVPYIYTEARAGYDSGVGLCRPLYYEWPELDAAYRARDQYQFGRNMLVAPVLKPANPDNELAELTLWLPPGRWFDTARGCFERGGRSIRRGYLASEIPMFVRPGTVIPGQRACTRLTARSGRDLVVTAYPGGAGRYRLYEDDGVSQDYQRDQCAWILLEQRVHRGRRTVTVGRAQGRYQGFEPTRSLELRLPATAPPAEVRAGSRRLKWTRRAGRDGWTFDGQTATVIIRVAGIDLRRMTTISVREDEDTPPSLALGLKGLLARLARVSYYNRLATSWLILDAKERLGVDAEQAGNRISRHPATLGAERRRLRRLLRELPAMLRRLARATNAWAPEPDPQRQLYCDKALALLKAIDQERRTQYLKFSNRPI
jgi:alpha-glucosidase